MEGKENYEREEIFSKSVRAGRRTYFFDVRSTRAEDYYMTITESKKFSHDDGTAHYKKHKIYLYKEDFEEFAASFKEVADFIFDKKGREVISSEPSSEERNKQEGDNDSTEQSSENFSDVKFEDI
ncbi:MAG: DNA-binding protein [Flavobacteriales bacterium]|nr:DNA-binding protein [Flavobacteriales bacterium]|tara:strand:- start:20171 stop:20545 length:375 start_codon:yes stop_codon:yes gene_type:complete